MDNNTLIRAGAVIGADITISYSQRTSIARETIFLARELRNNGIDLDFILVLAGGNENNLRELTNLAYEEFMLDVMTKPNIIETYNDNT